MNQINIIGRLGQNPEYKQISDNFSTARFSVAVGEKIKKNGEYVDHTEWFVCEAYNRTAEVCRDYLTKGKQVAVTGKIRTDTYEKDGETKRFTKVMVSNVEMLGSKSDNNNDSEPEQHSNKPVSNPATKNNPAQKEAEMDELPF